MRPPISLCRKCGARLRGWREIHNRWCHEGEMREWLRSRPDVETEIVQLQARLRGAEFDRWYLHRRLFGW